MNTRQNRSFRMGSLAIAFGLLAGLAPALGAQEMNGGRDCSEASLEGTYGSYRTGMAVYGAVAAQGIYFFDGEGGWQLRLNISRNGEISVDEEWEGEYTVNADCTGEFGEDARFVIVDDGKGVYLVALFEGFAMYEVFERATEGAALP